MQQHDPAQDTTRVFDGITPRTWDATIWRDGIPVRGRIDPADAHRIIEAVIAAVDADVWVTARAVEPHHVNVVDGKNWVVPEHHQLLSEHNIARANRLISMLADLERNAQGVPLGEPDPAEPSGFSQGNPHLSAGQVIGYDAEGRPWFVPGGSRADADNWDNARRAAQERQAMADANGDNDFQEVGIYTPPSDEHAHPHH